MDLTITIGLSHCITVGSRIAGSLGGRLLTGSYFPGQLSGGLFDTDHIIFLKNVDKKIYFRTTQVGREKIHNDKKVTKC